MSSSVFRASLLATSAISFLYESVLLLSEIADAFSSLISARASLRLARSKSVLLGAASLSDDVPSSGGGF